MTLSLDPGTYLAQGRYEIHSLLHRGYWSVTLRGVDLRSRQIVILKTPTLMGAEVKFQAAWMQQVFQRLGTENHAHRVPILDYFEENTQPFLVMAAIPGRSLAQVLGQQPLPEAQALQIIRSVGSALEAVHNQGLLHRDIKPENLIIDSRGKHASQSIVLADWGLQPPVVPPNQSSSFAAPEQFHSGGMFSPAIDLYSLAATLYSLVTGQAPLHATLRATSPLILPRQLRPQISPSTEQLILQGLELDPQLRPQSLNTWLNQIPTITVNASPVTPGQHSVPPTPAPGYAPRPTPQSAPQPAPQPTPQPSPQPMPVAAQGYPGASNPPTPAPPVTLFHTPTLATVNRSPVRLLLSIVAIAATTGLLGGLVMRFVSADTPLLGILSRSQGFPEQDWPGDAAPTNLPKDFPTPDPVGSPESTGGLAQSKKVLEFVEPSYDSPPVMVAEPEPSNAVPPLEAEQVPTNPGEPEYYSPPEADLPPEPAAEPPPLPPEPPARPPVEAPPEPPPIEAPPEPPPAPEPPPEPAPPPEPVLEEAPPEPPPPPDIPPEPPAAPPAGAP